MGTIYTLRKAESKMTEEEVLAKLQAVKEQHGSIPAKRKVPGARSLYLGGGWWGDYQPELLIKAYVALLDNPTVGHIHVPLLSQYGGNAFVDGKFEPDYEWATMTYKADLRGIDNSDIVIGLFPVEDQDTGTSVELGYAVGTNKPIVAVFQGDAYKNPINLMISMSADASLKNPSDLDSFNFLDIEPNMYEGRLI